MSVCTMQREVGSVGCLTRLHRKHALRIAALDVEYKVDRHCGAVAAHDMRRVIDSAQPRFDALQVLLARHQIDLIEEQPVCERDLRHRLVHRAVLLLLVEMQLDVSRVHHGDNAVETAE
eukprot:5825872-Prymnesium_polylepis.2